MKRSEIKRRPLSDTALAGLEPDANEYRELDGNYLDGLAGGIVIQGDFGKRA